MIHFITPLYRNSTIKILYMNIINQIENFKWHLIEGSNMVGCESLDFLDEDPRVVKYKIETHHIWGHEQRNFFIKNIVVDDNDWCYFLDDDNYVTQDLIDESKNPQNSNVDIILFSQKKGLTEIIRLHGMPGHLSLGNCDIGSFLLRYKILKNCHPLQEPHRNSDGHFCSGLNAFEKNNNIKYLSNKYVRYNGLSWNFNN